METENPPFAKQPNFSSLGIYSFLANWWIDAEYDIGGYPIMYNMPIEFGNSDFSV